MNEVVIVAALRTPIGKFGGAFKDTSAVSLGTCVVGALLEQSGIQTKEVDELIFGNVLQAGLGQNVARQVAMQAGLPESMPSFTVNKVCGSGLKAVALAAQSIRCGDNDVVIAGGCENMSQAPFVLEGARWGLRLGSGKLNDTILCDGLSDAFHHIHMGETAENIASAYGISRAEQDAFAVQSQNKAEAAINADRFKNEIVPLIITQAKGATLTIENDEFPRFGSKIEHMAKLRPAFKENGSVTAANASGINDGAAALLLMSSDKAHELNLRPMARIIGSASAGVSPLVMGTGPVPAIRKLVSQTNVELSEIDRFELNEAFAAQALAVMQDLDLPSEKVNVNGGAIALGHPIGASGSRILVSLLHELERSESHYGLASLCIGGGQGIAMLVEAIKN